ncbi:acyl-CoA thioesterase [Leeia oryzae]|uniref:acyl-CoA thioesterase n=1 Tax=Leeia oryzae TaxID=356662 RepID=UPI00037F1003|nr:thioesterase family protein [Leeia oryzae]
MHTLPIKIRGYHLDGYGHVNNARYLEFMEEGRWSLFEQFVDLQTLEAEGHAYVVVSIDIEYRRAANMHDELRLETRLLAFNRRHITVQQHLFHTHTNKLITAATVTLAVMSVSSGRSMVIEGGVAERLQRMLEAGSGANPPEQV